MAKYSSALSAGVIDPNDKSKEGGKIFPHNFKPDPELTRILEEDKLKLRESDFPLLRSQLSDWYRKFYGPSTCEGCGRYDVIRADMNQGADAWEEINEGERYRQHRCTHLKVFKGLAGKVLTILDASLLSNPKQHKAICDLIRQEFRNSISHARALEGDRTQEGSAITDSTESLT